MECYLGACHIRAVIIASGIYVLIRESLGGGSENTPGSVEWTVVTSLPVAD